MGDECDCDCGCGQGRFCGSIFREHYTDCPFAPFPGSGRVRPKAWVSPAERQARRLSDEFVRVARETFGGAT
jgi:hypothetical protein